MQVKDDQPVALDEPKDIEPSLVLPEALSEALDAKLAAELPAPSPAVHKPPLPVAGVYLITDTHTGSVSPVSKSCTLSPPQTHSG